jgi:alpha-beta hydrolase superfamily lysophospholipase
MPSGGTEGQSGGYRVIAHNRRGHGRSSETGLEGWLRERATHWPFSTLLNRARIVGRD